MRQNELRKREKRKASREMITFVLPLSAEAANPKLRVKTRRANLRQRMWVAEGKELTWGT